MHNSRRHSDKAKRFAVKRASIAGRAWYRGLTVALIATLTTVLIGCSSTGSDTRPSTPVDSGTPPGQVASNFAKLTWDAADDPSVIGYRVYYTFESIKYLETLGSVVDVGPATSHTVTELESGKLYWFAVTSYTASGKESAFSNSVYKVIP